MLCQLAPRGAAVPALSLIKYPKQRVDTTRRPRSVGVLCQLATPAIKPGRFPA